MRGSKAASHVSQHGALVNEEELQVLVGPLRSQGDIHDGYHYPTRLVLRKSYPAKSIGLSRSRVKRILREAPSKEDAIETQHR